MLLEPLLKAAHIEARASFCDFSGWNLPRHYGSQLDEHHQVRQNAGIFDVSHMGIVDIKGASARAYLRKMLANDIEKLKKDGQALYSCLLNNKAGIIDDLIAYRIHAEHYRLIINAGSIQKDIDWLNQHAFDDILSIKKLENHVILALQGPKTKEYLPAIFSPSLAEKIIDLKPFESFIQAGTMVARTGYTGEWGVEIIAPADEGLTYWTRALQAGAAPCGLASRDTLRLEAGYPLYGSDMNEETTPLESNLAWTLSMKDHNRVFIGREALIQQQISGLGQQLVGAIMTAPGVLRNQDILHFDGQHQGVITSGSFSPTLGHAIALARVPLPCSPMVYLEKRGKQIPLTLVKPPFIKKGLQAYKALQHKELP